jgi:hypothetical protein
VSSIENVKLRVVAQQLVDDSENRGAARLAVPDCPDRRLF